MSKDKMVSFRISNETIEKLKTLVEVLDVESYIKKSQRVIVEIAIVEMYQKYINKELTNK